MAPLPTATFTPRAAIVTGSAMGIGRAVALRLAADGLNVLVNDLPTQEDAILELVKELEAVGVKATHHLGDAANEVVVQEMVKKCVDEFGSLDVMVCNAGTAFIKLISNSTWEDMEKLININTKSVFLGYKYAAQQMIQQGTGGRIIGAGSNVAKKGYPAISAYSASKFAVRGLTQSAAQEWGAHGITVNTYCPGVVMTPLIEQQGREAAEVLGVPGADPGEMWAKQCALARSGRVEDVAGLVSFFASKDSGYITGQSINIDGGGLFD